MKKTFVCVAAICLVLSSCGVMGNGTGTTTGTNNSALGNILGSVLSSATNGTTITNVLSSVIGLDKLTASTIVGNWTYEQPGCAFTSENLLAQAGGEVAASSIKQQLATQYSKLGISSANTTLNLASNGTFTAKIAGKSLSGNWTFDESTQALKLQTLLLSLNGYAKRNGTSGISVLFDANKLLSIVQTLGAASGNSNLSAISSVASNYNGCKIGFDMR